MVRGALIGAAMLTSGCYMDLTMGVQRASGGVTGFGWELALTGGVAFDVTTFFRPSIGFAASMARNNVEDGKFGTTGFAYHARADVRISGEEEISESEIAAAHPGMVTPEGGATGSTRITLDYGLGKYEELRFVDPAQPDMIYTHKSTTHHLYLGIAKDYYVKGMNVSFGIGPSVTLMPNDFVGDTTAIGVQFHSSYWFIPVFRPRKTGSMMDTYTGPTPITPLPTAPDPVPCYKRRGDIDC